MGGGVDGNFGRVQVFSSRAHQDPISPIWRENLGTLFQLIQLHFCPSFCNIEHGNLRWLLAFDSASTNLIIFSCFLVHVVLVHHIFLFMFFIFYLLLFTVCSFSYFGFLSLLLLLFIFIFTSFGSDFCLLK